MCQCCDKNHSKLGFTTGQGKQGNVKMEKNPNDFTGLGESLQLTMLHPFFDFYNIMILVFIFFIDLFIYFGNVRDQSQGLVTCCIYYH
jgi:hypothetical protein